MARNGSLLSAFLQLLGRVLNFSQKGKDQLTLKTRELPKHLESKTCPNCGAMYTDDFCNCGFVEVEQYITVEDIFMCRTHDPNHPAYKKDFRTVAGYSDEATAALEENAQELAMKVNSLFTELGKRIDKDFELNITSGWRPVKYSQEIGTSVRSNHTRCQAIDIYDPGNKMYDLLSTNLDLLEKRGMAREHKSATKNWLHLQIVLPRSGRTTFYP